MYSHIFKDSAASTKAWMTRMGNSSKLYDPETMTDDHAYSLAQNSELAEHQFKRALAGDAQAKKFLFDHHSSKHSVQVAIAMEKKAAQKPTPEASANVEAAHKLAYAHVVYEAT